MALTNYNAFQRLRALVTPMRGAKFLTIDTLTPVPLLGGKSNPYQGRVFKLCSGHNVEIFQNKHSNGYENMVKRRLKDEGKHPNRFVLSPRAWGERMPNIPFVEHEGQYYFEVIFMKPGQTVVLVDGVYQNPQTIAGYPHGRQEAEQGGLSDPNKVIIRTYKCEHIVSIKVNGVEELIERATV